MNDTLTKILGYAYDHGIGIEVHRDLPDDWPSVAIPQRKAIMLNANWGRPDEVPFMAAHEIGHVLNGDSGRLYYDNKRVKSDTERDADRTAIKVLYNICKNDEDFDAAYFNPVQFMENFKIPDCYRDYVQKIGGQYYGLLG
ncbi:ImmA/IrrE family metallo-endopeptidase [Lacticaseibacillus pabuli]|uniref:ImmA/IrrE family metallo-endopeptidase n=1 Tax=Lacticaseibacillus pabuli TaxID=3025672 RepID=A0ABY7WU03_9LACO|nr:ImmA/IrrE family metallo-endopeptidase [Lacticaseibacillus sp. KACC 23028]WDF83596.1 ImmA/IrrE family metallo-endopeptidase [Lacticaseibacillus sp. KACC 23028]